MLIRNKVFQTIIPLKLVIIFIATGFSVSAYSAVSVEKETLHEPRYFRNNTRASFFDADDDLHVFYGGNHLYHAELSGGSWQIETIDDLPQVGWFATGAQDGDGSFYVLYWDNLNEVPRYITNRTGSWVSEEVPVQATVSNSTGYLLGSIVVDSNKDVHIVFGCNTYDLCYAKRDSSGWVEEVVETNVGNNFHNIYSVGVKSDGSVAVSYKYVDTFNFDATDVFKVAVKNSGAWSFTIIDSNLGQAGANQYEHNSLAIDVDDYIHIAYRGGNSTLFYATDKTGEWVVEEIRGAGGRRSGYTGIVVSDSGLVSVSSMKNESFPSTGSSSSLYYSEKQVSGWVTEEVDFYNDTQQSYTSVALSSSGAPDIVYFKGQSLELFHATKTISGWVKTVIEKSEDGGMLPYPNPEPVGLGPSLAFDGNGEVKAAYLKDSSFNGDIFIVEKKSGDWANQLLTKNGSAVDTRIEVDGSGFVHILDVNQFDLFYIENTSGQWIRQRIDATQKNWNSDGIAVRHGFTLDANGDAHVAYIGGKYDFVNEVNKQALFYATNKSGAWDIQEAYDIGASFGSLSDLSASMSIDTSGFAHIGFQDRTRRLMHVTNGTGNWVASFIAAEENSYQWGERDLLIDENGFFYMAYQSFLCAFTCFEDGIKYASNKTGSWVIEVIDDQVFYIDSTNSGMDSPSLTLDQNGNPHIGFRYFVRDFSSAKKILYSSFEYAYRNGLSWESLMIEDFPSDSFYNYVRSNGDKIYYAYHDVQNQSLMLATISGTSLPLPEITVTDSVIPANDLSIAFGNINVSAVSNQVVTVSNDGAADLVIGQMAANDPLTGGFSIQNDTCSNTLLSPGDSCTLSVLFSPQSAAAVIDSFDIPSNDGDEDSVIVNVSGTGTSAGAQGGNGGGGGGGGGGCSINPAGKQDPIWLMLLVYTCVRFLSGSVRRRRKS